MNKPYIFAHRGAMGYCIENTMESFRKAVDMRVGIETDIHLTKDNHLVCFHDPVIKSGSDWYIINNLTLKELNQIKFVDSREIPPLEDVFKAFLYCPKNFRYSCDIGNKYDGTVLIDLLKKYSIFDQVEITDTRMVLLKKLREYSKAIQLVHTVPYQIKNLSDYIKKRLNKLTMYNINVLNIKSERANEKNFKSIIDNGFKCYVWDVNTKVRCKRVLKLRYKNEYVRAIYSNYPDVMKKLRDSIYN